jgi:hypothetical protein
MTPQENATVFGQVWKTMFSKDQWDLIYAMVGHALDDDEFNPEDVYLIRNTIHTLFDDND